MSILILDTQAEAAINSSTDWEVRSSGNVINGGGFYNRTPGTSTDWSQYDTATISVVDLESFTGSIGTKVYSPTATFNNGCVGNIMQIRGGANFTTGFYEITAFSSVGVVTLDRNCNTAAASNGLACVGGGVATASTISASIVDGNKIYIKSGTYKELLDTSVSGSNGISWIGYVTDHSTIPYGNNRPLFDGEGTRANCIKSDQNAQVWKNLRATRATGHGFSMGNYSIIENCSAFSNGDDGINMGGCYAINCDAYNNTGFGLSVQSMAFLCNSFNNTAGGFEQNSVTVALNSCISKTNTGSGFSGPYGSTLNCISFGNTGATTDGFYNSTALVPRFHINCISKDNGRYAFNLPNGVEIFNYNCYNGHSTELNGVTAGINDVGDVNPVLVDPSNSVLPDFTLKTGSPCIGTGMPMISSGGVVSIDYNWNIGVDQGDHITLSSGSVS